MVNKYEMSRRREAGKVGEGTVRIYLLVTAGQGVSGETNGMPTVLVSPVV